MADNLTIYQRLSKLFGPAGPTQQEPTYQKFKIGPNGNAEMFVYDVIRDT